MVEDDINSELVDYIFTRDKSGGSGNLILIIKCNRSLEHTYELMTVSNNINVIKLESDIPIDKKYNVIEIQGINKRDVGTPYITIDFKIKKGLNIGIIKISLIGEIKEFLGVEFTLRNKTKDRTITSKAPLNLEDI
ncbi:hypothetical protein [Clostridium magnum]|uniref:Uncharacterized protein n=1 Tax=Clostridium magnum DSM 2767 TaxID=1121326 RepID=A0A162U6B1_9CLOT|nr:hypothetical protein [Clostridium magnum]KZL93591.1 hypothetical protein CLMAG_06370 [Clostridium magnum DSM 2767]SHI58870.1 hypothetical protein SAMN02745944_04539 [Clostridium magnum DSM 2767]